MSLKNADRYSRVREGKDRMGILTDARRPYREGRPRLRLSAVCIFSEHHGATVQIESRDAQSFRSAGTPRRKSEKQH